MCIDPKNTALKLHERVAVTFLVLGDLRMGYT